jgi:hypothetical protein
MFHNQQQHETYLSLCIDSEMLKRFLLLFHFLTLNTNLITESTLFVGSFIRFGHHWLHTWVTTRYTERSPVATHLGHYSLHGTVTTGYTIGDGFLTWTFDGMPTQFHKFY